MTAERGSEEARSLAEAVARRSYGKLVAFLATRTRDVASAEDALLDAFAAALVDWPRNGTPDNPEAWLLTVARRKEIDASRRRQKETAFDDSVEAPPNAMPIELPDANDVIPDRRLALMFVCAHPAIDRAVRTPLILQTIVGLDAARIASVFLTSPAAMGKRLTRAKDKIRNAGIPFDVPARDQLPARTAAVLDAVYATFGEGWSDPDGQDAVRRELSSEGIFLARVLADVLPDDAEALGLLALVLHVEARRRARRNNDGEFVPLSEQEQTLWNWEFIEEAEGLVRRAASRVQPGRYQLEAAIQSAHVYRLSTGVPNWSDVLALYDALAAIAPSSVVAINRALAVCEVHGPAGALIEMPCPDADPRLLTYQPFWAARADLLARSGSHDAAVRAYEMAIGLEPDDAVRRFLMRRRSKVVT